MLGDQDGKWVSKYVEESQDYEAAIRKAIAEEREACAQVADKVQQCWMANLETQHEEEGDAERAETARDIAAAIRNRS